MTTKLKALHDCPTGVVLNAPMASIVISCNWIASLRKHNIFRRLFALQQTGKASFGVSSFDARQYSSERHHVFTLRRII
jgi:hypothetical protein